MPSKTVACIEIRHMTELAKRFFHKKDKILTNPDLKINLRRRVSFNVIFSVLLYDIETWIIHHEKSGIFKCGYIENVKNPSNGHRDKNM